MKKKLLFGVMIAVLTIVAGLIVNDVAQGLIRGVLVHIYQSAALIANAIPDSYYQTLLLIVILLAAARSLRVVERSERSPLPAGPAAGRTAEWREWLERATRPAGRNLFYRWRVARSLARLAGDAVAHQKGLSSSEGERLIEDGDVEIPAEVQSYFVASMWSRPHRPASPRGRLLRHHTPGPFDLEPARAVEWIETLLEVTYDNQHP